MKPELKLVEDTGSQRVAEDQFDPPPQQAEMPFAVVDGEPITELPRDLYIPPDALQVFLEAFEGPLDLLLYLIRRQNLDILDIPIAEITRQYMKYIDVMHELQLELAGEYLLMAAMLAEIKSRMLLPRPPSTDGAEEEDPRAELVRRLQEYERFKKAAEDIDQLPRMERDALPTSVELMERKVVRILPQVTLQEMLLALKDVMSRAEMFAHHQVQRERLSVRQRMSDILGGLREASFMEFTRLFRYEEGRMGVTVTFSAILELMKEGLIEIVQAEPYAPIHIRPASGSRHLKVVGEDEGLDTDADAENQAALAQPAYPDENDLDEEDDLADEPAAESDLAEVESETSAVNDATPAQELADASDVAVEAAAGEATAESDVTSEEQAALDAQPGEGIVQETESHAADNVTAATGQDENQEPPTATDGQEPEPQP
ncbi:MAG TPA: ScpA family protein [Povalibacter sp.]|nr:ScpA family protein [Povalibacter sp.]